MALSVRKNLIRRIQTELPRGIIPTDHPIIGISGIYGGFPQQDLDKTSKLPNNITVRKNFDSESIVKKLEFYYDKGLNVHLEGKKGVGKTSLISKVLDKKCTKWLYFSASTCDPFCDFVGVPKEVEGPDGKPILSFIRPEYMTDDIEAIFLDEYNRAPKKIRNATMELIQFKSINGRKFPKLKCVWIGTNPFNEDDDDNEVYDVEPLDPAQADRFQIFISIPYAVDEGYFNEKFGPKWTEGAMEWWWGLPDKIKDSVSPRRLDYAMELAKLGGDVFDVIPLKANPSKLLVCLQHGGIEKIVSKLYETKDKDKVLDFFGSENNYQATTHLITQNQEWASFFVPLLDEERQVSLFFSNETFKKLVFDNSLFYKELLEVVRKNGLCDSETLSLINFELDRLKPVKEDW